MEFLIIIAWAIFLTYPIWDWMISVVKERNQLRRQTKVLYSMFAQLPDDIQGQLLQMKFLKF